jgi:hypothetical protein
MSGSVLLIGVAVASAAFAAPKTAKPNGDKVICRELGEIGSRLATKRVCLTRDQWREQAQAQRTDLDKAQKIRTGADGQ